MSDNSSVDLRTVSAPMPRNMVKLTPAEMMLAATAGVMRQVENIKVKRKPAHGSGDKNDWQLHIEGCLGEFALSRYLGIHWPGKGRLRHPDVGEMDVRTRSEHWHDLPIHEEDDDGRPVWLLTGRNGSYIVRGWIHAKEGKDKRYWKDPAGNRPAYFVPQDILRKRLAAQ